MSDDVSPAQRPLSDAAYRAVIGGATVLMVVWALGLSGALGRIRDPALRRCGAGAARAGRRGMAPAPAPAARAVAVVMLYVLGLGLAALTLGLAMTTLGGGDSSDPAAAEAVAPLVLLMFGLLVAPAFLLSESARLAVGRLLPVRPDAFRHWAGLVVLLWFTAMPLALLPFAGGQPPLAAVVEQSSEDELTYTPWAEVTNLLWTILLCAVGAGFPLARGGAATLDRLGLRWPGWRRIAAGVGLALALVVVVLAGVMPLTDAVLTELGVPPTSDTYFEKLVGPVDVGSAVLRAVKAGLGEELVWRGLVQPRYGLGAAAVGFAAMHGFQYGPSSLVVVLVLGVSLGLVRRWSNTTVAVVVHGVYDLVLFLAVALVPHLPEG